MYKLILLSALAAFTSLAPAMASAMAPAPTHTTAPATAKSEQPVLTLEEAVSIAVKGDDPALERFDLRAAAREEIAIADAQLVDPRFSVAAQNLPIDSFKFDQEPMTQLRMGLRQELPRGKTLRLKGEKRKAEAQGLRAGRETEREEIALSVRLAWLDLHLAERELEITHRVKHEVNDLIDSLAESFAQGRMTGQNVLRAELELALLDDRITELEQRADRARAKLYRYIGDNAERPLPENLPDYARLNPLVKLEEALARHPRIARLNAQIDAQQYNVAIAREAYKPAWALEGGYGMRGGDRPDFASIGVSVSVPIFPGQRQDRRLSAARKTQNAVELDRAKLLLELRRELSEAYADWTRYNSRIALYDEAILMRASETVNASISAYGGGQSDFPELIRSQLAELDVEASRLRLSVARAKTYARITYLTGDVK
jgi:outer membrane protein TolC